MTQVDFKTKEIDIEGMKCSYLEMGQGKPVLFLHGWGGSKESWVPLMNELKLQGLDLNKYHFYSLDLPGFGQTQEPPRGWDVDDYVTWFEKFLLAIYEADSLSGEYDLVVHSFGGRMLMKMHDKNFQHLSNLPQADHLVMVAAAGIKATRTLRLRVAENAAKFGKAVLSFPVLNKLAPLAQKVLYKLLKTHDYEKSSGIMRETFLKVIEEDLRPYIVEINRPSLILWGTKDSYLPVKDGYFIHSQIKNSELHIIKDGKHGIHRTFAKDIAGWIKNFIVK